MSCSNRGSLALSILAASVLLLAACSQGGPASAPADQPEANTAPAPPAIPQHDPAAAPAERAAPPTLRAVVLGEFAPANAVAESATGALTITDGAIEGANGASFSTERVALVNGDDRFTADARFADAMMIEPRQQVELRHVIDETPPTDAPDQALCGTLKTGHLAIARVMDGDVEVVKLLALSGEGLPAGSATDVGLCGMAEYRGKSGS
ncbi:MAG TPA: hypothetical protein VFF71_09480 [Luteimonas sp.]|nr:hypothetical protein [Luteimonas sp.]